jgi:farnesyl-diphosphate farnesyltransferase
VKTAWGKDAEKDLDPRVPVSPRLRVPPLDWSLLKRVSRSFYLTLRLLPGPVREPISLAYLLARYTDTEADGAVTEAEKELLGRRGELESRLGASPDRDLIETVWRTIQEGQRFDQERFSQGAPPLSEEELDRYTYLVAGCVGEFWTRICARRLPGFAARSEEEMSALGVNFGKGLQLVNILRDRPADRQLDRVYVPDGRLTETLALARNHLQDAERYAGAVKIFRLRVATALPLLLARETLDLVEHQPSVPRVKVKKSRVWLLLGRALFFPLESSERTASSR